MCQCYNCENVESDDFLNLRDYVIEGEFENWIWKMNTEFERWTIILLSWHYLLCENKFMK